MKPKIYSSMKWVSHLKQYDNIYLITGFHEIDKFLLDYNMDCKLNLIVTTDDTDINNFLRSIIKNSHFESIKDIPFGVPYWSDRKVNKYVYTLHTLIKLIQFRMYLFYFMKENNDSNLFIYTYINNISYYIFKKYFDKVSTGNSVVFKVPGNSDFRLKKEKKLFKFVIGVIYQLVSGVKLSLYQSPFYECYGFSDVVFIKDTSGSWSKIIKKYTIPELDVGDNSVLIIDGPIQSLVGVDVRKSLFLLEQYTIGLLSDYDVYLKPHYGHSVTTFDNSNILPKLKIIKKGYPVELYMHLFKKVYFFTSTAIASCDDECKPISLLDILVYDNSNAYQENIKLLKYSVGSNIDKITFAKI